MNRRMAMYAGTIALALMTGTPAFSQVSTGSGAPPPDSTMGKGAGTSTPKESPSFDKKTDLTGGKQGIPEEYADTPVRQGKLVEMKDSKYLNASVYGTNGEEIGKIQQVMKDEKTGDIEYVVFVSNESKRPQPIRWSQFKTKGDKLQLTLKKEEIQNALPMSSSKDKSPDLQEYKDKMGQVREAPTVPGSAGVPGQKGPDATGSMGEESVGGGGPSGTSGLPSGKAPGFEGGNPSSKR
ncbi:MAG: PRC-barrel domain-containing protein [Nitrospira sp.]|mgnify:CR=1 FL=1|nr:PRC-barrel domain-containing protein [Nitrospira sp.]MBX3339993.1 PRC-barrel domain-containing protein [Nitrospira sp.]MCW5793522.1 PRC-barrel domain-containing protein [Nitrospira sp.]HNI17078.1 PRC-barrel domain-containing protein [Nitrospira sp.]HNM59982.1 PRC-barrel domain-containing protein [Nitrospira sp.]